MSLLDVLIDLGHKPPVQHSTGLFITRWFHPSWQSTFLHCGAGKRGAVFCRVVLISVVLFFQLIAYGAATVGLWKMLQKKIAVMIENH